MCLSCETYLCYCRFVLFIPCVPLELNANVPEALFVPLKWLTSTSQVHRMFPQFLCSGSICDPSPFCVPLSPLCVPSYTAPLCLSIYPCVCPSSLLYVPHTGSFCVQLGILVCAPSPPKMSLSINILMGAPKPLSMPLMLLLCTQTPLMLFVRSSQASFMCP